MTSPRLWLFDIDGTLVDSGGAGLSALRKAAALHFGSEAPLLDLAGSTDLGVWDSLVGHYGHEGRGGGSDRFFETYHPLLEVELRDGGYPGKILPGVVDCLEWLKGSEGEVMGLLTGNTQVGAMLKVRHFGLASYFDFGAYGSDHADRNRLGPVALERARGKTGRDWLVEDVVVVGDTPKDIACARALGAKVVAVATGSFGVGLLRDAGADWVIESLAELRGLMA